MKNNTKNALLSVSIYPTVDWSKDIENWAVYLDLAKNYGFNEVFSSVHLPELALGCQIECLSGLAKAVRQRQMELTADIGGSTINLILENDKLCEQVARMNLSFLRLDYGYKQEQLHSIVEKLNIHGFVLNASILNAEEVERDVEYLHSIPNVNEIRACHNFYPRRETGITMEFLHSQYEYFHKYAIPVYACIPSLTNPRGPLYDGLPTVEQHRHKPAEQVALELINCQCCDGMLVSDEYITENEFKQIRDVIYKEPIAVKISLDEEIIELEKEVLLGNRHRIRYDSNNLVLRSQSSRQMAEYSNKIPKRKSKERTARCITIDNELYGRYSGELQIVLEKLPEDDRVNVIGYIDEDEQWKLQYYKHGYAYQFYIE
ncbi:MAG: hypothetical protein APF77_23565 [Clostridia bacterium BRH_c25]|nr:MAG: hypothetical protein APF77_23565 [Clostridia bacterium BRH_c25]